MTTISEPRPGDFSQQPVVNYDEPDRKPAPLLAVGPLAWARKNLFSSWLDVILTVLASALVLTAVSSFVVWVIAQANWFVITFNLRQFMIGRYENEAEWRVGALVFITGAVIGVALAAWTRLPWRLLIAAVIVLPLMFILPPLIERFVPLPPAYVAAGNVDVVSGTSTETPQSQVAFVGKAGDAVSVQLADQSTNDTALAGLNSFSDVASNTLLNAAANRLETEARIQEIQTLLSGETLTANQRTLLEAELAELTVPTPVTETYALNQNPVHVSVLRGTTLEVIAEGTLEPGGEALQLNLPEDGWYILEKTLEGDATGVALLQIHGIYPLLERSIIRPGDLGSDSEDASDAGGRGSQFVRMTDDFTIEETRPAIDDNDVPLLLITDNQYRGSRPVSDYLSLFLGPFLDQINEVFLALSVMALVGYIAARQADRFFSPPEQPRRASRRSATWLLIALPVVMFALIWGVPGVLPFTDTRRWGGFMVTILLTVFGIIAAFPLGILLALGRRSELPAIKYASILYIEFVRGVPLITFLFMAQLLLPLVNPALQDFPNIFRAMIGIALFSAAYLAENVRGGLQAINPGQIEAAKALGLHNYQIVLHITLPQALRAVIPALVGQCISLFKDTSLVAIVGLFDLVGIARNVIAQTEFLGQRREVFVFIVMIYFVISYTIASISRRVEASGSGAALARQL
jgi:His/Glu/Gln/Arg/opine family amino acid ABC transporter permease subunit